PLSLAYAPTPQARFLLEMDEGIRASRQHEGEPPNLQRRVPRGGSRRDPDPESTSVARAHVFRSAAHRRQRRSHARMSAWKVLQTPGVFVVFSRVVRQLVFWV